MLLLRGWSRGNDTVNNATTIVPFKQQFNICMMNWFPLLEFPSSDGTVFCSGSLFFYPRQILTYSHIQRRGRTSTPGTGTGHPHRIHATRFLSENTSSRVVLARVFVVIGVGAHKGIAGRLRVSSLANRVRNHRNNRLLQRL